MSKPNSGRVSFAGLKNERTQNNDLCFNNLKTKVIQNSFSQNLQTQPHARSVRLVLLSRTMSPSKQGTLNSTAQLPLASRISSGTRINPVSTLQMGHSKTPTNGHRIRSSCGSNSTMPSTQKWPSCWRICTSRI